MYQCQLDVVAYTKDSRLMKVFAQVPVGERFHLTYQQYEQVTESNKGIGDIIVWDLDEPRRILDELIAGCKESAVFVLCAGTDDLQVLSQEQLEQFAYVMTKPLTMDLIYYHFKQLLDKIALKKDLWLTQNYLETTIDTIPDMVWFKDINGVHLKVNDSFCKAVDKSKKQVEGRGHCYIWDLNMEEYEKGEFVCLETDEIVQEKKEICLFDEKVKCKDGMRLLKTYKAPIFSESGEVLGTVGIAHDITSLSNLYVELKILLDSLPFSVAMLDTNNIIQSANTRLARVFGVEKEKMTGTTFAEWGAVVALTPVENTEKRYRAHIPLTGEDIVLEMLKEKLIDVFDNTVGYLVMFRDITLEQQVYEKNLLDANTDYLTGLYNRRYLNEYIEKNRGKHCLSLLYLDVDNFKQVNDSYGHPIGDKVLVDIANQLKKYFTDQKIFRLGGDEFLVVLPDKNDIDEIKKIAHEVRVIMEKRFKEDLNYPMLSVSIGVARDTEAAISPDDLLKRGDAALYLAKQNGKNCICVWN